MTIPDFIPDTSSSPIAEDGFRDWIPDTKAEENNTVKKAEKAVPINKLQRQDLTDQDLRDIGIDPVKYRKALEEAEDTAIGNLTKMAEEELDSDDSE